MSVGRSVGWLVGLSLFPIRAGSYTSMLLSEQLLKIRSVPIKNIIIINQVMHTSGLKRKHFKLRKYT